jgi:hypothetical protein
MGTVDLAHWLAGEVDRNCVISTCYDAFYETQRAI